MKTFYPKNHYWTWCKYKAFIIRHLDTVYTILSRLKKTLTLHMKILNYPTCLTFMFRPTSLPQLFLDDKPYYFSKINSSTSSCFLLKRSSLYFSKNDSSNYLFFLGPPYITTSILNTYMKPSYSILLSPRTENNTTIQRY